MPTRPNLLGIGNPPVGARGTTFGGMLPSMRPHYPASVARALHALAESKPTPTEYARERARILGGNE